MTVNGFFEKYEDQTLKDAGAEVSDEFKKFAQDMRTALRNEAGKNGIRLHSLKTGHYDVHGFFEKDGKYVYFSYSEPRHSRIALTRKEPMWGFLYRTAKDDKDYTGGQNHFTHWMGLVPRVKQMLSTM